MADEGVGIRQLRSGTDLLVRGVQLAVADVVGNGAGEEMGVLKHDAQGAAQALLADVPHVDPVVGDEAALDLIEAVDEVGNGGLSRTGGAHEGDLLPRLGVERDAVEDGLLRHVAEHHVLEAHVAPEGHQRSVRPLPGPAVAAVPRLGEGTVRAAANVHQGDPALVHLRGRLHDLEDPLRTGDGSQDVVHLLAHLADGLAHLAGVLEVHQQGPQVKAHGDGEQRPYAAGEGVVDVADVPHGGHHRSREGLGVGGAMPVALVALPETGLGLGLVVEHLDDLLALDHLLDIAVHLAQVPLLGHEVPAGALAHGHDDQEHHPQGEHRHQKQNRAEVQHHRHHAHKRQHTGDQGDDAVLQDLVEGVDVVGVSAHELAVGVGVKIAEGKLLHPVEQVPADGVGGLLGDVDHDAGVTVAEQGGAEVDARHQRQRPGQPGIVSGDDALVDQGAEHIRSADGTGGIEHQAHRHHQQQPL